MYEIILIFLLIVIFLAIIFDRSFGWKKFVFSAGERPLWVGTYALFSSKPSRPKFKEVYLLVANPSSGKITKSSPDISKILNEMSKVSASENGILKLSPYEIDKGVFTGRGAELSIDSFSLQGFGGVGAEKNQIVQLVGYYK